MRRDDRMTGVRPHLLMLMQLPPPVHGASLMNLRAAEAPPLHKAFDIDVLPVQLADSVADIGQISLAKLFRVLRGVSALSVRLIHRRPQLAYFTLPPVGGGFLAGCTLLLLLKVFRVRRVLHLHGKGIQAAIRRRPWLEIVYRWAFAEAAVIVLAQSLAAEVVEFVAPERIYVVPNGVADPLGGQPLLPRAGVGPLHILFLSNLVVAKGPLILLDALALLKARGHSFRASFAGAAYEDLEGSDLTGAIERRGLAAQATSVGPAYGEAKDHLLRQADVLAFPTFYPQEAFPLVAIEAMAYGLPVVTTPEGALSSIVEEGTTGFLVPQRDSHAVADALERLIMSKELCRRMGLAGRARYEALFTLNAFETAVTSVLVDAVRQ